MSQHLVAFVCLCLTFAINSPLSAKQIMWADYEANNIVRANLDGSNAVAVVGTAQGAGSPAGLAVDLLHAKMYWTDQFSGTIRRSNLDGTQLENLPATGAHFQMDVDPIGGKMFWADNAGHAIRFANLDGSNAGSFSTGAQVWGVALDLPAGKVYWTEEGRVRRANFDGSQTETALTGINQGVGIDLDLAGGQMYVVDFNAKSIVRANLNGTGLTTLVSGLDGPSDIALDVAAGKMYFTDEDLEQVFRANLDGSGLEVIANLINTDNAAPFGIALVPEPSTLAMLLAALPLAYLAYRRRRG